MITCVEVITRFGSYMKTMIHHNKPDDLENIMKERKYKAYRILGGKKWYFI